MGTASRSRPPAVTLREGVLPLVLVGLPGAGKTTVARLLAHSLGVQVTDTDAEIRRRSQMTIPRIFALEGEERFREREHLALRAVLASPAAAQGVVALGGGAVLRQDNRELLEGHLVVYLAARPQTAAAHVGDGAGRPLVVPGPQADADGSAAGRDRVVARMESLYAQRAPLYDEVASITVPTDGLTPEQVTALVLVALGAAPDQVAGALAATAADSAGSTAGRSTAGAGYPRVPADPSSRERLPAESQAVVPPASAARLVEAAEAGGPRAQASGPRRVTVKGPAPYEVLVGHDLRDHLCEAVDQAPGRGAGGVAVVHDARLAQAARACETRLAGAGLRVTCLEVPGGEEAKTTEVLDRVWEGLGAFRLGRDGVVVGLGGGAVTDLAGFAAASWLRGVPVVQAPTSLLAMVDAAVGGKTGINTRAGKNLVGAFHPPSAVVADIGLLATLPGAELRAGLGEVVKCGLIADPVILDQVLADPAACTRWDAPVLADLVARSVAVKAAVVGEDLRESGLREVLNYGHTYAHAVERVTGYAWRHGEAVAIGCLFAAHTAHLAGRLSAQDLDLHHRVLSAVGLPTAFPEGRGRWEQLHEVMMSDKKVRRGELRMVLLDGVGQPVRTLAPGEPVLRLAHEAVTGGDGPDTAS